MSRVWATKSAPVKKLKNPETAIIAIIWPSSEGRGREGLWRGSVLSITSAMKMKRVKAVDHWRKL